MLAGFSDDPFVRVFDPLAVIRLGWTMRPDFSSNLSHNLFVDSANFNPASRDLDLDPRGDLYIPGVRIPHR